VNLVSVANRMSIDVLERILESFNFSKGKKQDVLTLHSKIISIKELPATIRLKLNLKDDAVSGEKNFEFHGEDLGKYDVILDESVSVIKNYIFLLSKMSNNFIAKNEEKYVIVEETKQISEEISSETTPEEIQSSSEIIDSGISEEQPQKTKTPAKTTRKKRK